LSHLEPRPVPPITSTAHTLPFDRLSPRDFERLCLWLVEREGWERGEHLAQYRDCEVTVIIAATGEAEQQVECGICGFALSEVGECPRCKLVNEWAARVVRVRQERNAALFREVEAILRGEDE
jgi:phage FluMu protein Com